MPLTPSRLRSRITLIGLALIFFLPIAIAWVLNVYPLIEPGEISHGAVLVPGAPTLSEGGIHPIEGERPPDGYFIGQWTLLTVNPQTTCGLNCTNALYTSRQVRLALGRDIDRVRRVMVQGPGTVSLARARLVATVTAADGKITLAESTPAWQSQLASVLTGQAELGAVVFVVDPKGRLVLFHPLTENPGGLISDMKRLLRFSKIG